MNGGGLPGAEFIPNLQPGEPRGQRDATKIGHQAAQSVDAGFDLRSIALLNGGPDLVELLGYIHDDLVEELDVVGGTDDGKCLELVIVEERGFRRRS